MAQTHFKRCSCRIANLARCVAFPEKFVAQDAIPPIYPLRCVRKRVKCIMTKSSSSFFEKTAYSPVNFTVEVSGKVVSYSLTPYLQDKQEAAVLKDETSAKVSQKDDTFTLPFMPLPSAINSRNATESDDTSSAVERMDSVADDNTSTVVNRDVALPAPSNPEFVAALSTMLEYEKFESGVSNPSEQYFRDFLKKKPLEAKSDLLTLFMDNYNSDGRKANILVGILHMISHLSYEEVYPQGPSMALIALSYRNNHEVNEFGIKCFENWEHPDGIDKLRATRYSSKWLQEYADAVVAEFDKGG